MVAAVELPSFGPIVDHHFAERLPSHHHLGAASAHEHPFNLAHAETGDSTDSPTALYNHDSGLAPVVSMAVDASLLGSFLSFELSTSVNLPLTDRDSSKTRYPTLPD